MSTWLFDKILNEKPLVRISRMMRLKPRRLALPIAAFLAFSADVSSAQVCVNLFTPVSKKAPIRVYDASHTISQKIRDNAHDYWAFSREQGHSYFGSLIKYEGLVVGDTHPGNFILSPLNGSVRFFIADIKDAGVAPFVLDFSRLVLSSRAAIRDYEFSHRDMVEHLMPAYLKGLSGRRLDVPESLAQYFNVTAREFNSEQAGFVKKYVKDGGFKFKDDKLEPLNTVVSGRELTQLKREISDLIEKSYPGAEILDFAHRPRERGGSRDMTRYWALIEVGRIKTIVEFKQISEPATAMYQGQKETLARYQDIISTFWGKSDSSYQVVSLLNDSFFMRPKKYEILEVPYRQKSDEDFELLLDMALYDAFYLGTLHGKQSNSAQYLADLKTSVETVSEKIVDFSKDYKTHLLREIERIQSSKSGQKED